MTVWYYAKGLVKNGPLTHDAMVDLVRSQEIEATDLVWKSGLSYWSHANRLPDLTAEFDRPIPPPLPADSRKDENVAMVMQLLRRFATLVMVLWNAALAFWIRLAAWVLLRRTATADATQTDGYEFTLGDVFTASKTNEAKAVRHASSIGLSVQLLLVMMTSFYFASPLFVHDSEREMVSSFDGSIQDADREFEIEASQISQRGRVAARMLIELRDDDGFSWEMLESEVEFQFGNLGSEFQRWKQKRIKAGDRFE